MGTGTWIGVRLGRFSLDTILHVPGTPYNPQYAQFGGIFFNVLLSGKSYIAPKRGADRFIYLLVESVGNLPRPSYDEYQERKYTMPSNGYTFRKSSGHPNRIQMVIMESSLSSQCLALTLIFCHSSARKITALTLFFLLKAGYRFPKSFKAGD